MDEQHLLAIIHAYREVLRWREHTPGVQKHFSDKVNLDQILEYRLKRALIYVESRESPIDE